MLAARWCSGQQDTWTGLSVKGCPSSSGLNRFFDSRKMLPTSYFLIFHSENKKTWNVVILS